MSTRSAVAAHRGWVGFIAGAAAVGLIAGGTALASIPSTATGNFTGCVNNSTGALRVIDYQAGRRCTTTEQTINWSKGYHYRGTWSATVAYAVDDVAVYAGSSYVALAASTGKPPANNATYWGLLAHAGASGAAGPGALSRTIDVTDAIDVSSVGTADGDTVTAQCGLSDGTPQPAILVSRSSGEYFVHGTVDAQVASDTRYSDTASNQVLPAGLTLIGTEAAANFDFFGTGTAAHPLYSVVDVLVNDGTDVFEIHASLFGSDHRCQVTFEVVPAG